MAPPTLDAGIVIQVKELLGAFEGNGTVRRIHAALPADPVLAERILVRAARGSKKRMTTRYQVLLAFGDEGAEFASMADEAIRGLLADPKTPERGLLVQRTKAEASRIRFAPTLRTIAADGDDPDWAWAVESLGVLGDRGAVETLMEHTAGLDTPFVLLVALVRLRDPIGALVFEPNLAHPDARTRTFALWGLAALGHPTPVGRLVELLDEPDTQTPHSSTPGQSLRAAQALCDVFDWPFSWDSSHVASTRERCRERFSEEYLARCRDALERGRFELSVDE